MVGRTIWRCILGVIILAHDVVRAESTMSYAVESPNLSSHLEQISSDAFLYGSQLQLYQNISDEICSMFLYVNMDGIVAGILGLPEDLRDFAKNDIGTVYPQMNRFSQAIEFAVNELVEMADKIGGTNFENLIHGELALLGLGYSAVASSFWAALTANDVDCDTAMPVWSAIASVGGALESANSVYTADAVAFIPSSYRCVTRTTSVASTQVASPTGALYSKVGAAAQGVLSNAKTVASDNSALATSNAFWSLSAEIRLARNAASAHSSLVTQSGNVQGFKDSSDNLVKMMKLIYDNAGSYGGGYGQFQPAIKAVLWELAAMVLVEVEKAESLQCSYYRTVMSEFMILSTAQSSVISRVFGHASAAFPIIVTPYTHTCLQSSFTTPTVSWDTFSDYTDSHQKHGLSAGAWAGVGVGCGVAVFLVLFAAVIYRKRRSQRSQRHAGSVEMESIHENPDEVFLLGTCAQCGSDVRSDTEHVTCCEQMFHKNCINDGTTCLGRSSDCIGRPDLPEYEKPPQYVTESTSA